jgi:hypothetical protein
MAMGVDDGQTARLDHLPGKTSEEHSDQVLPYAGLAEPSVAFVQEN